MQIIRHRVNRLEDLKLLPQGMGAEIDIRSAGGKLVVTHDIGGDGAAFDKWLAAWAKNLKSRGTLIVNPKEDGIEREITEKLTQAKVDNYFFLDLTLPTLVRMALRENNPHVGIRFSEYEPESLAKTFAGKAHWLWADCFEGTPPPEEVLRRLRKHYRICLVSPELQGFPQERISGFTALRDVIDAVCTKHPGLWTP